MFVFPPDCAALAAACHRESLSGGDPIRFDQLAVGQRSRYTAFEGENCRNGDGLQFTHFKDTLVLEIVGQDAQGFKVMETLHYADGTSSWYSYNRDSTYYYYFLVSNDTLRLAPIGTNYVVSRLFTDYFAPFAGLPLANFTDTEVKMKGWLTDLPFCECRKMGFTKKYKLFGKKYSRLNVLMENTAMQGDGLGYTYVYSAMDGLVKFSTCSAFTSSGYGWDLLPE